MTSISQWQSLTTRVKFDDGAGPAKSVGAREEETADESLLVLPGDPLTLDLLVPTLDLLVLTLDLLVPRDRALVALLALLLRAALPA